MSKKNNSSDGFKSRWGFILAAMGSAIGLGNIWRYPVVAYENGGGAFLIPYIVALLTAGIPILILEFNLGNKFRGSAPSIFRKINPKLEFLGWLQTFIAVVVPVFYSAIIGWLIYYFYKAFSLGWGSDASSFFYGDFLKLSDVPETAFALGGFNVKIAGLVLLVWVVTGTILFMGVEKGIERVNKIMVPTLLFMYAIVVVYSLTLNGAVDGLQKFFEPQWSMLKEPSIWTAAYGQVFFSTSIAAGIMLTYASYTPKDSDLNSNAVITGLGNASVELAAGFGVFAALGFLAMQNGVGIDEVVKGGPGLVFEIYPAIINQLPPVIGPIVGVIFYLSLIFAGISSLISLVEVVISAFSEKFNVNRNVMVITMTVVLGGASLLIATPAGLYVLDLLDYFINTYIWQTSGAIQTLVVVLVLVATKKVVDVLGHGNKSSVIKVNPNVLTVILLATGCVLVFFIAKGVISDTNPETVYGGYPDYMINNWGWKVVGLGFVFSIILAVLPSKTKAVEEEN